jgi:Holliday junction resolvase-like predicted endonuclease
MNVERELTISILKLAGNVPVEQELVNRDAKIPSVIGMNLIRKMQNAGLVYLRNHHVETEPLQRMKLAVHAIKLGADPERVTAFLEWNEFEHVTATVFEMNGYTVTRNLRFKEGDRRWEIDVVACRKPIVLCLDCKHWHRTMFPSVMQRIAAQQIRRTESLARFLPNPNIYLQCSAWQSATLVPGVLSLLTGRFKFCDDVPIVSILQLPDFLMQMPAIITKLRGYETRISRLQ